MMKSYKVVVGDSVLSKPESGTDANELSVTITTDKVKKMQSICKSLKHDAKELLDETDTDKRDESHAAECLIECEDKMNTIIALLDEVDEALSNALRSK